MVDFVAVPWRVQPMFIGGELKCDLCRRCRSKRFKAKIKYLFNTLNIKCEVQLRKLLEMDPLSATQSPTLLTHLSDKQSTSSPLEELNTVYSVSNSLTPNQNTGTPSLAAPIPFSAVRMHIPAQMRYECDVLYMKRHITVYICT